MTNSGLALAALVKQASCSSVGTGKIGTLPVASVTPSVIALSVVSGPPQTV